MSHSLTYRRWQLFKKHTRGYVSLWVFLALFIASLFAELIANDRPLLIRYNDTFYYPIIFAYPETRFGGDFDTEAEYRDPYVQVLIQNGGGWVLWPLVPYNYSTIDHTVPSNPSPPGSSHWLGTDDRGRDVVARLIYGFRLSVLFGLILTIFSMVIGVFAGAVQGYFGGWIDLLMQRFMELWGSIPTLFLIIILTSFIMPNFWWLLGILLLFSWMSLVGVVRAECLKTRNMDYVKAARVLGASDFGILWRHVLPNSIVAALTFMPFILSGAITTLTALDFLGFGLPAGSPSLGELLSQGKANIQSPWLGITGFLVIATMLSLLVFIGEAVRDAFDPRKT